MDTKEDEKKDPESQHEKLELRDKILKMIIKESIKVNQNVGTGASTQNE